MIGDDELAVLVRALTFQLIDPITGTVAAQLTTGFGTHGPFSSTFSSLDMFHRDVTTTDSSLSWTDSNGPPATPPGNESVVLTGPANAGAGTFRPYLALFRSSPGLGISTVGRLGAGDPAGVAIADVAQVEVRADGLGAATVTATGQAIELKADYSSVGVWKGISGNRGLLYGITAHAATLGVTVLTQVAATTVVTVSMPAAPAASAAAMGTFIDVEFIVLAQALISDICVGDLYVNGVLTDTSFMTATAGMLNAYFSWGLRFQQNAPPIGVAYLIELKVRSGAANSWSVQPTQTRVIVTNYR